MVTQPSQSSFNGMKSAALRMREITQAGDACRLLRKEKYILKLSTNIITEVQSIEGHNKSNSR